MRFDQSLTWVQSKEDKKEMHCKFVTAGAKAHRSLKNCWRRSGLLSGAAARRAFIL